jgi:1-acyl-sn-glycerol-3-phosphate acyltransferase
MGQVTKDLYSVIFCFHTQLKFLICAKLFDLRKIYFYHYLYYGWVLFVFSFFMILFLPGFLIPPLFGYRGVTITYFFLRLWSWVFSRLNFIPYEIYGREHIKKGKSYIYVSNHTSFLDIPGMCLALPGQFRPLAKKELLKIPVFGWIASTAAVIVDRSNHDSRVKSLEKLTEILAKGISILIFPEGTQNRSNELLQPFKDGAFRIALETKQPILPIMIVGAGKLMPPGKAQIFPGRIKIFIGEEIPTDQYTVKEIAQLKAEVFGKMKALVEPG